MAKRRIFTVGFTLPGDEFEYVKFVSDQTLLDADIILFEPNFGPYYGSENYNGQLLFDANASFVVRKQVAHWKSEIVAAVNAGKLVIVYLVKPEICYRYTGEKRHSGTGRSQSTTNIVAEISSYAAVPNLKRVVSKSGTEIRLEKDGSYLASYWKEFSESSPYEVEIEGDFAKILLVSRTGSRTVGASLHSNGGALLFLPPLHYDEEAFTRDSQEGEEEDEYWTDEALKFGKRIVAALVSLADGLKQSTESTPAPSWSLEPQYRLSRESELEMEITTCTGDIDALQSKKRNLEKQLDDAGGLRHLLFERGKLLESAILEAMRLFGFDAQQFSDGESEFDGVFVSPEGRCLGEAEGKDNKAVNIDKFSQLERNLQEDFARDDVSEYAKGLLFGNAYRLTPVDERGVFFTTKCISAAKRVGAALIRTPDLFVPAKYLKENPLDADYAKLCREAIFKTAGEIVFFSSPPGQEEGSVIRGEATAGALD